MACLIFTSSYYAICVCEYTNHEWVHTWFNVLIKECSEEPGIEYIEMNGKLYRAGLVFGAIGRDLEDFDLLWADELGSKPREMFDGNLMHNNEEFISLCKQRKIWEICTERCPGDGLE